MFFKAGLRPSIINECRTELVPRIQLSITSLVLIHFLLEAHTEVSLKQALA